MCGRSIPPPRNVDSPSGGSETTSGSIQSRDAADAIGAQLPMLESQLADVAVLEGDLTGARAALVDVIATTTDPAVAARAR